MTDLVEFLRARLDEDESAARTASTATSGPWRVGVDESPWTSNGCMLFDSSGPMWENEDSASMSLPKGVARHIARHDPARVLAEVAAKRRIVEEWNRARLDADNGDLSGRVAAFAFHLSLCALALPYAEHPDYREEWKP